MKRLVAVLRMRCPRCRRGGLYSGFLRMREKCPVCELVFLREPGYFTGAMYASYFMGVFVPMPIWVTMVLLGQPFGLIMAVTIPLTVALMPLFFHYSRVLWLHIDYFFNPQAFEHSAAA